MDPQEGGEDILDRDWEQDQRQEMEGVSYQSTTKSKRFLPFCVGSRTNDDAPRVALVSVNRPVYNVDFVFPGVYAIMYTL